MVMNDTIHHPFAGRNWLLHAAVERSIDDLAWAYLDSWLNDTLRLLALPDSLLEKVRSSARNAAAGVPAGVRQFRLLVFMPGSHTPADQTWGFFRMVKNGGEPEDPLAGMYEVAFYLYAEGSAKLS